MRIGDPDGHGYYGQLTVDDDGRLLCHECGGTYLHLATHLTRTHSMRAEEYRLAHGLPLTRPLIAATISQRMAQAWEANRDEHLEVLARVRNPARARAGTRPVSQWTAATRAARIEKLAARRARELTDAEKNNLGGELPLEHHLNGDWQWIA